MALITAKHISACLVTRGNVPMEPIIATLPYDDVVVWNNSYTPFDMRCYGRFAAVALAKHEWIYFQDDDVIFTEHEQLIAEANLSPSGHMTANDGHGGNYAGYEDLAWTAVGALVPRWRILSTWAKWFDLYPSLDQETAYQADAIFGILCPFRHVDLPYTRLYADDRTRMCGQEWQESMKALYVRKARMIRDRGMRIV